MSPFSPELAMGQGDACCAIVNIAQDDVGKKKVNELGAFSRGSAVLALSGELLLRACFLVVDLELNS